MHRRRRRRLNELRDSPPTLDQCGSPGRREGKRPDSPFRFPEPFLSSQCEGARQLLNGRPAFRLLQTPTAKIWKTSAPPSGRQSHPNTNILRKMPLGGRCETWSPIIHIVRFSTCPDQMIFRRTMQGQWTSNHPPPQKGWWGYIRKLSTVVVKTSAN